RILPYPLGKLEDSGLDAGKDRGAEAEEEQTLMAVMPEEVKWMWELNEEARPEWKLKGLEWFRRNRIKLEA
ncbi:MAG: hypothetical protein QXZ17_06665, partial [Nitrososphaerota archaeon]